MITMSPQNQAMLVSLKHTTIPDNPSFGRELRLISKNMWLNVICVKDKNSRRWLLPVSYNSFIFQPKNGLRYP